MQTSGSPASRRTLAHPGSQIHGIATFCFSEGCDFLFCADGQPGHAGHVLAAGIVVSNPHGATRYRSHENGVCVGVRDRNTSLPKKPGSISSIGRDYWPGRPSSSRAARRLLVPALILLISACGPADGGGGQSGSERRSKFPQGFPHRSGHEPPNFLLGYCNLLYIFVPDV